MVPLNPGGQLHENVDPLSVQMPPLSHGLDEHGVTSHVVPEYPAGQLQTNPLPLTVQSPEFRHGADVQGVTSQFVPLKPGGHAHEHVAGGPALRTLTPSF